MKTYHYNFDFHTDFQKCHFLNHEVTLLKVTKKPKSVRANYQGIIKRFYTFESVCIFKLTVFLLPWNNFTYLVMISFFSDGSNLLHFTTGENSGVYGSRMPALYAYSNSIKFYQSASGNGDRYLYNLYGTIDSLQNVIYRHAKRYDGKFWFEIILDGELKYQYEDTTPTCMENMKLYASDPWYTTSTVTIQNFKIITGKLDSITINFFLVLNCY